MTITFSSSCLFESNLYYASKIFLDLLDTSLGFQGHIVKVLLSNYQFMSPLCQMFNDPALLYTLWCIKNTPQFFCHNFYNT